MCYCTRCGDEIHPKRRALGYTTCLSCGSPSPVRTVVPMHKSNYVLVTDRTELAFSTGKTAGWTERIDR